ncbi:restriction endonuclease subunit S [Pseudomonas lactis]|uniref:restriction endonuclease subunit S n=1 Tax=Pseudomonas TaxID=286 RepID=UPI000BB62651|nr:MULTISPECIES: restriction endonuclease subunit S [Pseudomonas]MBA5957410.1 restriction endonuclease subunit S [Pseudomonas lactis]PRW70720.1 restriction endonuclease subunit S [Pseudomonas fluorescens]PRW73303.1 restriction endonuclease subunit S [Pseudomonas fluorescens]
MKATLNIIPLSETTKFIVDNRGRTAPTEKSGIPLIATNCVNNSTLYPVYENLRFVSQDTYDNWFRAHPRPGDILLTLKGSQNGAVCLVPEPVDFVIAQDMVALRVDESVIDRNYLFAALRSPDIQSQIKNLDVSGVIPHLKKTDFDKLLIPYPDRAAQLSIGNYYFCLSKKIDLLHRQNKVLEAMAESLFRLWFVGANSEGWTERSLSGIARFLNGLACQKYPPENALEKLPVLKIRELSSGISEASDWATNQVKPDYIVEAGDVIFAWSASLMVKIWDGERCVLNQHLFKVTSDEFPKWFYLLWCKHHLVEFISISSSHATTMGHIKRGDLDAAIVLIPTAGELEEMSKQMEPLLDKQIANAKQIKSLEKLRDTLLPKLMSGEARVSF